VAIDRPAEDALRIGTSELARRVAQEAAPGTAAPPPLTESREPAYLAQPQAGGRPASERHLLRAWKDVHVQAQTHVAAIVILALAGLALGVYFGLD
jgi:hypothetical protein